MRFPFRSIVTLSILSLALVACSRQDGALSGPRAKGEAERASAGRNYQRQNTVNIGVQPLALPENAVTTLLLRDRILAARLKTKGLQLRSFSFTTGREVAQLLLKGDLDAGVVGDMPALNAAASGDIVIVALLKQGFCSIIAARPILPKELKGKTVAATLASTGHFALLNALENEGLTERDVHLVGMDVAEMPKAMAEGKIDAFSAWEPTPMVALASHPEFHLVHKGITYAFLCFRREFAETHPAEVEELVASVARSCFWMRLPGGLEQAASWTREAASQFQGREYPLSSDQVIASAKEDLLSIPTAPRLSGQLLQKDSLLKREFEYLVQSGKLSDQVPWRRIEQSFHSEILQAVLANPKMYQLQAFDFLEDKDHGGVK